MILKIENRYFLLVSLINSTNLPNWLQK